MRPARVVPAALRTSRPASARPWKIAKSCTMMQAIASPWCSHRTPPMLMSRAAFGCLPISPRVTAFFDIARLHAKADRGAHLLAVQHLGGRTRLRVRASRPRSRPHGSSGMVALPSESSSFSSGRRQQMSPRARTPSWQPLRTGTRRLGYLPVHIVAPPQRARSTRDLPSTWTTFCANSPTVPDACRGCSPSSTGACGIFRGIGLASSARLAAS